MISKITRAYVRTYTDNGQTVAYVEWIDNKGKSGRTEGGIHSDCCVREPHFGSHMTALLDRAKREGLQVEREQW